MQRTAKRPPPTRAPVIDLEAALLVAVADNERLRDQQGDLVAEIIRLRKNNALLLAAIQGGHEKAWVMRNKRRKRHPQNSP